jgi:tetratricopeptide (TPR) repeat protein
MALYLNHDVDLGWLIAMPYGEVADEALADEIQVSDAFRYVSRTADGGIVGFVVRPFASFDPEAPNVGRIWREPLFDAPQLGLWKASAGEICLAAKPFFAERSSVNRDFFDRATASKTREEAAGWWRLCLQAGDAMAHYGLGYTLLDLGETRAAYRHLRAYTEVAPLSAWAWCYRGKAAQAIGDTDDARASYRRAIALEGEGGEATDAPSLLEALDVPDDHG